MAFGMLHLNGLIQVQLFVCPISGSGGGACTGQRGSCAVLIGGQHDIIFVQDLHEADIQRVVFCHLVSAGFGFVQVVFRVAGHGNDQVVVSDGHKGRFSFRAAACDVFYVPYFCWFAHVHTEALSGFMDPVVLPLDLYGQLFGAWVLLVPKGGEAAGAIAALCGC